MRERKKRLTRVADAVRERLRQATNELDLANARLTDCQEKIDRLASFSGEYGDQFLAIAKDGMSGGEIQRYKAFMGSLQRSLSELETKASRMREDVGMHAAEVEGHRLRALGLENVLENVSEQIAQDEDRSEQREFDEVAGRRFGRDRQL